MRAVEKWPAGKEDIGFSALQISLPFYTHILTSNC